MVADKTIMSVRRVLLLYLTITFPLAQRLIPIYSAQSGKQAGWLSPIISSASMVLLVLVINRFYKAFDNLSFIDIVYKITGKTVGKIICTLWGLWILIELCKFVRYFAERTISTIMVDTKSSVLIALILITVAIGLYSGIIVLCRINEIILPIILFTFLVFSFMIAPSIELSYLTPISCLDIIPILKGSIGITGIWAYLLVIFFINDGITNREQLKTECFRLILFLTVMALILNLVTIGVFDYSVVERFPSPYIVAIKDISVFNTFQKIEPIAVSLWLIEDFLLFSVFSHAFLALMKSLFGLSKVDFLIAPMLIFVYFFSQFIAESRFALDRFSNLISVPVNILLFIILPVILFFVGKIGKKL